MSTELPSSALLVVRPKLGCGCVTLRLAFMRIGPPWSMLRSWILGWMLRSWHRRCPMGWRWVLWSFVHLDDEPAGGVLCPSVVLPPPFGRVCSWLTYSRGSWLHFLGVEAVAVDSHVRDENTVRPTRMRLAIFPPWVYPRVGWILRRLGCRPLWLRSWDDEPVDGSPSVRGRE